MITTDSVRSNVTGVKHYIKQRINCDSRRVIYLIECARCNEQYVGETERKLKTRMNEHRSDIVNKLSKSVSRHFNSKDHCIDDMKVYGLEKVQFHDIDNLSEDEVTNRMLQKESSWVYTLRSAQPLGLNVMDQLITIIE